MEKYNKPPLPCDKQIDLLSSRGLEVSDRAKAEQFLSQVNYYRLSAYCLPFGTLSQLYHNLLRVDQIAIARSIGYHSSVLSSWLHTFTYTRNICAHHSRIWNRQLSIAMVVPKKNEWSTVNTKRIGSVIFAINNLMAKVPIEKEIRLDWQAEINELLDNPVDIPKFYEVMGLSGRWKESRLWKETDEGN